MKGKATHSSILPGESCGLYCPWGRKESDTSEQLSLTSGLPYAKHIVGGEVASSFIPETELSIRVARPWTLADSSMPRSLHL